MMFLNFLKGGFVFFQKSLFDFFFVWRGLFVFNGFFFSNMKNGVCFFSEGFGFV